MAKPAPNANRLPDRGALIDRSKPVSFKLNGETLTGYEGDTLASALIANGRRFIGRSFKYHRPRGFVASGVEEPNGLFGVGEGGAFEPNQRGTMVELHPGLTARTQNHFPTLEYDLGSMNALMSRMFPAGFYYKTFIRPRRAWKHVFEPIIRQAAGLGKAPTQPDDATYEQLYYRCDVLVAGGGPAGLMAAKAAAQAGARVLLVEQSSWLGGRALVDDAEVDGRPIAEWVRDEIAALRAMPNVTIRTRTQASALTEHNYVLCAERVADHDPAQVAAGAPRQRLWRVRAGRVVVAAGAIERPLAFACNDVPGVMLASAVRDYVTLYGVKPGDRVVIYANNDDAYRTAVTLREAGVEVPAILDARDGSNGDLPQRARQLGLRMLFGAGVARALGGKQVEAVEVAELRSSGRVGAMETVACDCVAMS
ncbi:MAG: 2Fe-2S iron-sulfur cluster-binding protein, partial [Pseudomonadota bacterium]